ncbi:hypothetical protein [Pontibacter mangrovi]|uniref:Uncharacterized protein n=1 Tax=Pontibacter mangrovi TaxID=2589816 RepID=A0A501W9L7_9BACT|nr:hypothetical protein [Pontibacter mangrovi]TPE43971.1 hypothetical protein FJM65_11135 [Pontibacter mangrovi]
MMDAIKARSTTNEYHATAEQEQYTYIKSEIKKKAPLGATAILIAEELLGTNAEDLKREGYSIGVLIRGCEKAAQTVICW